jgi:hypothetical protein
MSKSCWAAEGGGGFLVHHAYSFYDIARVISACVWRWDMGSWYRLAIASLRVFWWDSCNHTTVTASCYRTWARCFS